MSLIFFFGNLFTGQNCRYTMLTSTTETTKMEYRTFEIGQKVRSVFGELLTVVEQVGCMVYVAETSKHYHPSKLFAA
jgi:hypothetical protein